MRYARTILGMFAIVLLVTGCFDEARVQPYFDQLEVRLAADQGVPDVMFMDSVRAAWYIKKGLLEPVPADLIDPDFDPTLLRYFQKDGATYALPLNFTTVQLMVNQRMLEENGLEPPRDWDTFTKAAFVLSNQEQGIFGLGLIPATETFAPFVFMFGGSLQDGSGQFTLATEPAQSAMQSLNDLVNQGAAYVAEGGWPYNGQYELLDRFAEEKIGMMLVGPSHFKYVKEKNPNLKVSITLIPQGPIDTGTVGYVRGYAVFKRPGRTEEETKAAFEFLRFATSADSMRLWLEDPMYLGARGSVQEEWRNRYPEYLPFLDGLKTMRIIEIPVPFNAMQQMDINAYEQFRLGFTGQKSAGDVLRDVENFGNESLRANQ